MSNLTNIIAYFEDLATRHPAVQHSAIKQRFFDLEWDEMVENGATLAGTGWNVVLEDFKEEYRVDGGEHEMIRASIAIMVLTNVPRGKQAEKNTAYENARQIAKSFLAKMKREHYNDCEPDLPIGVFPPEWIDLNAVTFTRVQPRFTGFDHSCGVRMVVRWQSEIPFGEMLAQDDTPWIPLT